MKWIVRLLVVIGLLDLIGSGEVFIQLGSNDGLKHVGPLTGVLFFIFASFAFVGAYGCAKQRKYGWISVVSLLSLTLIADVGNQLYLGLGFRFPLVHYLWIAIRAAFWAWLIFLWFAQLRHFEPSRGRMDSSSACFQGPDSKRTFVYVIIWCAFAICCVPFLVRALAKMVGLFWMFRHASPGGP